MTAGEAMSTAAARLRTAGVPDPARDARVLLAHAAQVDAIRITLIAPEDIEPEIVVRYEHLIALRSARVPVSHLIGEREFYGRKFKVSPDVLDPRPETETLIEAALSEDFTRALDLGVGSGCILVTLLAERSNVTGVGTDLSEDACLQASVNVVLNNVADRVEIINTCWFDGLEGRFDLIVSNPPYLTAFEMEEVAPELRDHEPRMALTDEGDGLSAYRVIAVKAGDYLTTTGRVICEIGYEQGEDVFNIFRDQGWGTIMILPDLDERDRVIIARNPA